MRIKKLISLVLTVAVLFSCASFPVLSAGNDHSLLTHLDGFSLIETDLSIDPVSDLHKLFDGDISASHAATDPAQDPDGNGLFGTGWFNAGDKSYIIIDLGDLYELSQVKTYWGWAPQARPSWNNWEYDVPSSYTIYVSDTKEGLETAEPAQTVTGLSKNSDYLANSTASVSAAGRYVKIVSTYTGGLYALRELEFVGARKSAISPIGANIRLESEGIPAGLRFGAKVDKAILGIEGDWSYDPSSDIEFGMYILPASFLDDGQTLAEYLGLGGQMAVKVPAKKIIEQDEKSITYTAVLVGIPESSFGDKLVAVPYVTTTATTTAEETYFAESTRSYVDVASDALNSYENGNPNGLTEEQYDALKDIVGETAPDTPTEPEEPEEPEEPNIPIDPTLPHYDIDEAAKAKGINTNNNSVLPASLFVDLGTTYGGYKIDGKYKVDADTLRMLATVPCSGNGTVAYKDYNNFTDYIKNKSYGEGCGPHSYGEQIVSAPVSKLSDPLYMSMVLPSEGSTYQNVLYPNDPRNNGNNMHKPCNVSGCNQCAKADYTRLNALGAVYMNQDKKDELENYKDVQFKICLGNIRLLVKTANGGWQQVKLDATPSSGNGSLYCLPWQYEWNSATSDTYLANCKSLSNVSRKNGYSEITVSVSDFFFTKTFKGTDGRNYTLDERLLHFWGSQYRFSNDADILGIIASYDMWIEYDESIGIKLEDYFISSIGADWRLSNGSTKQSFAGYKHAVSTEKTTVFGHNMGPSDYDTLVTADDLVTIKGLLGIQ